MRVEQTDLATFTDWLLSQGYVGVAAGMDGMWQGYKPLLSHWTLHQGAVGDVWGYQDGWCYADRERVEKAFEEWRGRGFQGEPIGWRKHPATGRCRNDDGDPATERVGW